jgi:hypothetical protein
LIRTRSTATSKVFTKILKQLRYLSFLSRRYELFAR